MDFMAVDAGSSGSYNWLFYRRGREISLSARAIRSSQ